MNACEVKVHLIGCWQNLGAVCFWQPIPSGLILVVAVLRVVSQRVLSYIMCKVELFVLTIIKRRLLLLLTILNKFDSG